MDLLTSSSSLEGPVPASCNDEEDLREAAVHVGACNFVFTSIVLDLRRIAGGGKY
jgi:hypothetical protein